MTTGSGKNNFAPVIDLKKSEIKCPTFKII